MKKNKKDKKKTWSQLTDEERRKRKERNKRRRKAKKEYEKEKIRELSLKQSTKEVVGYQEVPISQQDIIRDYNYLSRLPVSDTTRDWVEHTMYELRERANKYEKIVYAALKEKGVEFIHQAPFVLDGKIYFADFYIPALRTLIEVDGYSHENVRTQRNDYLRDDAFASYRMQTYRIQNSVAKDKNKLDETLTMILFNR